MKFRIYDRIGNEAGPESIAASASRFDVLLFGELHDNLLVHEIELALARELVRSRKEQVILGAEMFEADDQPVLDEYLAGLIDHDHFASRARVWPNYVSDYRPLVEFARENKLRFVATNAPRRYASLVAKNGLAVLSSLSEEERRYLAPFPLTVDHAVPGYAEVREIGKAHGMNAEYFVAAQALKDATMAWFITRHARADRLFFHVNGDYHSKDFGGICWHLRRYAPELQVRTISSVAGDSLAFSNDFIGRADWVLVVQK